MRRHRHELKPEQQQRLAAYLEAQPVLKEIYRFKQRLCYTLLKKHRTRKQCEKLAPRFLRAVQQLRQARLPQLAHLGGTLHSWAAEIATMWRFTRNNGITEGFHTKMEVLQRQAYISQFSGLPITGPGNVTLNGVPVAGAPGPYRRGSAKVGRIISIAQLKRRAHAKLDESTSGQGSSLPPLMA